MTGQETIALRKKFASFVEVDNLISKYSEQNYIQLYKRDCKTFAAARKRVPESIANAKEDLQFYYVRYCCINGGKEPQKKRMQRVFVKQRMY